MRFRVWIAALAIACWVSNGAVWSEQTREDSSKAVVLLLSEDDWLKNIEMLVEPSDDSGEFSGKLRSIATEYFRAGDAQLAVRCNTLSAYVWYLQAHKRGMAIYSPCQPAIKWYYLGLSLFDNQLWESSQVMLDKAATSGKIEASQKLQAICCSAQVDALKGHPNLALAKLDQVLTERPDYQLALGIRNQINPDKYRWLPGWRPDCYMSKPQY